MREKETGRKCASWGTPWVLKTRISDFHWSAVPISWPRLNCLSDIRIERADSANDIASIRELFLEYAASLEISLCFQNFDEELAGLPGKYAAPAGRLLLARDKQGPVGCVALRPLEENACEMKRLYVRPRWRGKGLGRLLGSRIIDEAIRIGYQRMRLDTLDSMKPAIALYLSLGFQQIQQYCSNPSDQAVFMERLLTRADATDSRKQNSMG